MAEDLIDGRYRLDSPLARSAMAEVWLAQDLELQRPVALKLLAPDADRARFDREARAAAALAHPNVMRLYDYGEADGRPFMALEYLPGGTLEERLADGARVPDDEVAAIAAQLAAGLAHAHAQGLVHRDLKPANVLFDAEGRPKLADFGIARITGSDTLTETGTMMGTAGYISPEQAAGETAGPASDVYSFGALLYRMLTGRLPFEAESPFELAELHRRAEPPAIDVLRPDVPPELGAVVTAALAKNPRDRPPDGAALASMLGVPEPGVEAAASAETLVVPSARQRRRPVSWPLLVGALLLLAAAGVAAALLTTQSSSTQRPARTPNGSTNRTPTTSATSVPGTETTAPRSTSTATATTPATPSETSGTTVTSSPSSTVPTTTTAPTTTATVTTTTPTASAGG